MNYYYDILVNLQEVLLDFLTKEVTVSKEFLNCIIGKTVIKNSDKVFDGFLLTDLRTAIFLEVNEEGKVIYRSKLLVEDENNLNEIAHSMKTSLIDYQVGIDLPKHVELRKTLMEKRKIKAELNNLTLNKNEAKLNYLYYEWFHELSDSYEKALKKMKEELDLLSRKKIHLISHLIMLSYQEKL